MDENLDDDCLSLLLQMLINLRSRLQRVCVTTTKGKARRKKVSARSINYCFIYLYSSHSRAQMEEFHWYWVVERCRWQSQFLCWQVQM
jgi:hypothetical protein